MRTYFITFLFGFSGIIFAMEKHAPAHSQTLTGRLFHLFDQSTDPITYITQNESIETCESVLRLDPKHPKTLPFERDTIWLTSNGHIAKASRRQQALLVEVETSIFGTSYFLGLVKKDPNPATIAQIMNAKESIQGYFSPHLMAVLKGYYAHRSKIHEGTASQYQQLASSVNVPSDSAPAASPKQPLRKESGEQKYKEPMTYEDFCELVKHDNPTLIAKTNNSLRKNYYNTVGHLTHSKTPLFGNQLLRFDPENPGHNSTNWDFNPQLPLHNILVHKVFERERLLISTIETAIEGDDAATICALNYVNHDNPKAVTISEGYFSPVLRAMIAGYIQKKANLITADVALQQEQKKKEFEEKLRQEAELKSAAEAEQKRLLEEKLNHQPAQTYIPSTVDTATLTGTQENDSSKQQVAPLKPLPKAPLKPAVKEPGLQQLP